ncbi:MAG: type I 3-dehydroquinate dehydratase [Elusimicrobia bacterium]|nr:type I 3-dehydroquinate dehydratase [Elusimicrobiota bacterium]
MAQTSSRVKEVLAALHQRPQVVATLTAATIVEDALTAVRHEADLIELRVDTLPPHYRDGQVLLSLVRQLKGAVSLPLIVTIRDPREQEGSPAGGPPPTVPLTDELRYTLFEAVLPQVEFLDLELKAKSLHQRLIPEAHRQGKGVLLSSHAVQAMPTLPRLRKIAEQAKAAGADVVKIAAALRVLPDLWVRPSARRARSTLPRGAARRAAAVLPDSASVGRSLILQAPDNRTRGTVQSARGGYHVYQRSANPCPEVQPLAPQHAPHRHPGLGPGVGLAHPPARSPTVGHGAHPRSGHARPAQGRLRQPPAHL